MKEWIVVACRAEAKIFERNNTQEDLRWLKTLTNKKGRYKEHEFTTDKPGLSYAKFSGGCAPHALEGKRQHSEVIAQHFSKQISDFLEKGLAEKKFSKLTVFAGAHFIGILKSNLIHLTKEIDVEFVAKNIEKADSDRIASYME